MQHQTAPCSTRQHQKVLVQVKLEPGLLQEIPRQAGPLKVEIHDHLLDSGQSLAHGTAT